uniref:Fe2OG dioxygenase domain-containing protein n=1 Tax=Kalanchoe fedtschenkoi TaxID=63787 RepID=A0A7N0UTA6_KALFE
MSSQVPADQRRRSQPGQASNAVRAAPAYSTHRLRLNPNENHRPQSYEGCGQDFSPELFSKMEKHLPPHMLTVPRDVKFNFMKDIVDRYLSSRERRRMSELKSYREKIISHYQPLHTDLYTVAIEKYFTPRFLKAVNENSEAGYRSIMAEPSPGVFTFEIFLPQFCELLLSEVENIKKWVHDTRIRIMQPNTMVKCGVALNDFGLGTMHDRLMDYIRPVSKLFYSDIGGDSLDSNHGFIAEYGPDIDTHVGFHVDDSEVTLNICLGDEFTGGNLYFRGIRCDQHVNSNTQSEVNISVLQVPGSAVLHRGRHRHGAQEVVSGYRSNFILWCRSSTFREMKNYKKEFWGWCGQCQAEKEERMRSSVAAARKKLILTEKQPGA